MVLRGRVLHLQVAALVGREALPQLVQEGMVVLPQAVQEGTVGLPQDKETLHQVVQGGKGRVRICLAVGSLSLQPGCRVEVLEWDSLAVEGVHTLAEGVAHSQVVEEVHNLAEGVVHSLLVGVEDAVQSFVVLQLLVVVPSWLASFCIHTHSKCKR